jgi:peptidoglycan L-alanyl-D-glutamate endopeptidase CwlK
MATRSVWQLDGRLRTLCAMWFERCQSEGLDPLITCTYRSAAEQDELYELGRTKPGKKVTNAKGGQSKHNKMDAAGIPSALAFDFVPMRNGKCVWDTKSPENRELWEHHIKIAEDLGLVCGARWTRLQDWPHIQLAEEETRR